MARLTFCGALKHRQFALWSEGELAADARAALGLGWCPHCPETELRLGRAASDPRTGYWYACDCCRSEWLPTPLGVEFRRGHWTWDSKPYANHPWRCGGCGRYVGVVWTTPGEPMNFLCQSCWLREWRRVVRERDIPAARLIGSRPDAS